MSDGVLLADGVLLSDGVLLADSALLSDTISGLRVMIGGDGTTFMAPAP